MMAVSLVQGHFEGSASSEMLRCDLLGEQDAGHLRLIAKYPLSGTVASNSHLGVELGHDVCESLSDAIESLNRLVL